MPMQEILPHLTSRDDHAQILEQSRIFCQAPVVSQAMDAVPSFMLVLNEHRQVVFANLAVAQLLGIEQRERCYGRRPGELLDCEHAAHGCHGCGTAEQCGVCGAARAIRASELGSGTVAECCIHQKSMDRMFDLRVATSHIDVGNHRFAVLALTDIAHEKRRQAMERIFFHDLLNTLGALTGYVELLGGATGGQLNSFTSPIMRLSDSLVEEVRAQRDLGSAENNELAVHRQPANSREILEELAVSYRAQPASHGRTILLGSPLVSAPLHTDRRLLLRILGNMLKNALEASPAGRTVTLQCDLANGTDAIFSVHNDGVIPREVQLRVFHRAFSTKGNGRGLGTYSMKLLGEKYLGGKVWFKSTPESGTVFFASIPAVAVIN